jgi:hypothetical protein
MTLADVYVPDPGFGPRDDRRHWAAEPGGRMRDSAEVSYASEKIRLEYRFEGIHDAFSYRSSPDGLPSWFAANRLEQTGRVSGFLEVGARRIEWDRRMGHRDHSWGTRDWGAPHHWKWFVAYTDAARAAAGL